MRRPPFRRGAGGKPSRSSRQRSSGGLLRRLRPLRNVLLALAALSLFQYLTGGEITWHRAVLDKLGGMAGSGNTAPRSGWGKAVDTLERAGARREGSPPPDPDLAGRVTGVLDGDSIIVLDGSGDRQTIRLFGIDAPERGQPHAEASKRFLSGLLARQSVAVVVHGRDRYGRWTGTVYLGQRNVNLAMVEEGHAWWYRHYAPHDRLLEAAEAGARERRAGLWSGRDPVPPWEWRRVQFRQG